MKIAIDGGGLCAPQEKRFGNFTFSFNFIQSILNYDKNNYYSVYSLCPKPQELNLTSLSDYRILLPHRLWMKVRVSLEEFLQNSHVFLALNQAIPLYTRAKIIAFSHGLSYYYFPHLYRDNFFRLSIHLGDMVKRSSRIIVSSKKVMEEMNEMFPQFKKITVIPFGIPIDMLNEPTMQRPYKVGNAPYFLFVGMDHPIKNIPFLLNTIKEFPEYKLYLVGNFSRKLQRNKNVKVFNSVCRNLLLELYSKATVYLTASYYESFNLPVLEALAQGAAVVGLQSAIIPELRPYVNIANDKEEFINAIKQVINNKGVKPNKNEIAAKFSWKNYVNKLVKLYNE